jgi:superfamily II DNA or RNA helicase
MYKDFADYSSDDPEFDVEEDVHRIYSGKEKEFEQSVVITTWQSAIKLNQIWFQQFGCVVGDEAHTFKAKSLTTIMSRLSLADMRVGTTGTLDGGQVNELTLMGNFGPVYKVTSTQTLIDSNTLADLKIEALVLKYSDETRKAFGKKKYAEEIDFLVSHEKRNRFIANLALDQKGNSLVLYNLVKKHGEPLFKQIRDRAKDRKVFFVSGSVNAEEREKIREITEQEKNAIIVASVGTFSTGINIKSLNNIIFASPTKSQIRVLQSIGRGLRKSNNGQGTVVYDIADDLSWKSRKNYTLNHAISRVKIYDKESFKYKIHSINI